MNFHPSHMLRITAALALSLGWSSSSALAAEDGRVNPAGDASRITALVSQLGSEDFTEREAASDALIRVGLPAFAALEAAAAHPDREVRYRSIRVLGQIREHDLKRRLEAFLSGKETADNYPLPGWNRFKKAYGDDAASRKLFVEMTQADAEVLRAIEDGPKAAAESLGQRALVQQQAIQLGSQQQVSLGQIAAVLFVAAEADVELPGTTLSTVFQYCHQPALRETLSSGDKTLVPRKIVGALIRRSEDLAAYSAMHLANAYGLEEGMVPALKILNGNGNRAPHYAQLALVITSRFGDRSHLPLVEKLLDDRSVFTRMQENKKVYEVQVRDAALATAIILTRQDLKAYFTGRPQQEFTDPQQVFFNPRLIGFEPDPDGKDEQRAEVHKKWADYKARQSAEKPIEEAPEGTNSPRPSPPK